MLSRYRYKHVHTFCMCISPVSNEYIHCGFNLVLNTSYRYLIIGYVYINIHFNIFDDVCKYVNKINYYITTKHN
jgi:hypothetical protein